MGNVVASLSWCLPTICSAVLRPGLKLEYFWQYEWDDEWIDMVENLVHEKYVVNYEKKETVSRNDNTKEQSDNVSTI